MEYQLTLNWPDFLERHWQKRPVVLKRGFSNFIDPLSPDELAGLAMESEIDSRLVSHQDGKWQVSHGPFESYDHLGESNWSLLVQAVNHWHEPTAALMRPFRALPDWRIDDLMISFSVPGGGVGPHLDQYDVFIIQGTGRRRWRVGEKLQMRQHCPHPDLLQVEPFEAIIDEELEPGDILYIPPGFPHEGYALENAMNYSVGFRAPNSRELISGFADYVLQRELGNTYYSDPDMPSRKHPADILPQEMDKLRNMMLDLINQPAHFQQWVLGYPFAWFLAKLPEKIRPLLLFLLIVPFWTNSLIRIYGLKIFLSTKGYLNEFLLWLGVIDTPIRIMFTPSAVIIGLVYILLPFMVMPLYSSIEKLDKPLLEAARDLGASKMQTFIRIIIPLTMPGIVAGCLLVMLPAMGLFYVSDLMGGAKNLLIGNVIKVQFLNIRDWPFGAATSITLTIVMGLMLLIYWRASRLLNKKVSDISD